MDYQNLSSVNGSVISVTTTAAKLFDLINTAAGSATAFLPALNAVDLHVESGSVRISFSDNVPTASKGILLNQGVYFFRNVNLANMRLISATGSTVSVSVEVGQCGPGEANYALPESTNLATKLAGEDITNDVMKVEQRFSYANILTATTTTVKSGAGFLHSITFNKPVASEVWTIYDNTAGSGTKIGTITLPGTLLGQGPITAIFDVSFSTGLTIVSGSTTDGTVSYR